MSTLITGAALGGYGLFQYPHQPRAPGEDSTDLATKEGPRVLVGGYEYATLAIGQSRYQVQQAQELQEDREEAKSVKRDQAREAALKEAQRSHEEQLAEKAEQAGVASKAEQKDEPSLVNASSDESSGVSQSEPTDTFSSTLLVSQPVAPEDGGNSEQAPLSFGHLDVVA